MNVLIIVAFLISYFNQLNAQGPSKPVNATKEYKLSYTTEGEDKFSSKEPLWLPLPEKRDLPTLENQEIKVTILEKGTKSERLQIDYNSTSKIIRPIGGVMELELLLDKVKYKYRIKIAYQNDQWIYRRACYLKVKLSYGLLCFFDENSNGKYNDYGIDGIFLPDSSQIEQLNPEIYLKGKELIDKYQLEIDATGTRLKLTKLSVQDDPNYPLYQGTLEYMNQIRKEQKLPLLKLNENLCNAIALHLKYGETNDLLKKMHAKNDATMFHSEDPKLPGYTTEGDQAARASVIIDMSKWPGRTKEKLLRQSVDLHLATFYHRIPLLLPGTRSIGIGQWTDLVSLIDLKSDCDYTMKHEPVPYPYDGQTDVPLEFGLRQNETPNPLPEGAPRPAGYPVTLTFDFYYLKQPGWDSQGHPIKIIVDSALLKDKQQTVDCYLYCPPDHLANPQRPDNGGSVCLIPVKPLQPATKYTVEIKCKYNEKPFIRNWSFTTVENQPEKSK